MIDFRGFSPCKKEEKNQDRACRVRQEDWWIGVVCDGTTQSMYSDQAAEIATCDPFALWTENGVSDIAVALNLRRAQLIASAKEEEPEPASFFRSAMIQFVRDARERSFQTTLVTARVTPIESGRFLVEAKAVGDSALLIFDGEGHLLGSNLPNTDGDSGFGHLSSITQVLPDHFTTDELVLRREVDSGTHVVLCSDGFYDAFGTPGELFDWLVVHEDDFRSQRDGPIEELHERLDRRIGDDDVSFLWLCAQAEPEKPAVDSVPEKGTEAWFYRIFSFLRRSHGEDAS